MIVANVFLWGKRVGAVLWNEDQRVADFEYDPAFVRSGLDIAPLRMPLKESRRGRIFRFPNLNPLTFQGLPGLLADCLPDRYGRQLIAAWLTAQGRDPSSFTPVEHLCYLGHRGMGALVFEPATQPLLEGQATALDVSELVRVARQVLSEKEALHTSLAEEPAQALEEIISVGTSAGGARAKAVIAFNPNTREVRSGQVDAPSGFEHWLLKLDGVTNEALGDPKGFGRIEFAYYQLAQQAGIHMSECQLLEEGGRAHFMTRRFDRVGSQDRLHVQTLCGLAHYDYNRPELYAYEQAFQVIRELRLGQPATDELFRRLLFNVVARNQDDHTKNISFLMDPAGEWTLAPAYDVTYSFDPANKWMHQHQLSIGGKRDGFSTADLLTLGKNLGVRKPQDLLAQVGEAVRNWPQLAHAAHVPETQAASIGQTHRLYLVQQ